MNMLPLIVAANRYFVCFWFINKYHDFACTATTATRTKTYLFLAMATAVSDLSIVAA